MHKKRKKILPCFRLSMLLIVLSLAGCSSFQMQKSSYEKQVSLEQKDENAAKNTDEKAEKSIGEKAEKSMDENVNGKLIYESSMELSYAEKFAVDFYQDGCALISVVDAGRYLVVPEHQEPPQDLDDDIVVLQQPLDKVYLVASAVMDMVCQLDALDSIRFSGQKADGWSMDEVREAMENGKILYAGKYNMPDYELIVSEGCSLAIENNMISHAPEVAEKLESFGIPVFIDCSSYESHPLGRVEWVKLYGVLFREEEAAQSLFQEQVEMMERAAREEASGKTVAFFYITADGAVNVRSTWDYIPKMIELAGGRYIFDDLGDEGSSRSSVSMQMEEFYSLAKNADYLVYNSTIDGELESMEELLEKEALLKDFKAVQEGNVWCTTRDWYQQTMSIGGMIEDMHHMLSGEETQQEMEYLYPLKVNQTGA